jgi:hypothetical protein
MCTVADQARLFNVSDVDPWAEDDPPRLGPTPGCSLCRSWGFNSTCPGCGALSAGHYADLLLNRIDREDQFAEHARPWLTGALRGVLELLRGDELDADQIRRRIIIELEPGR